MINVCPKCLKPNEDFWPLDIDREIIEAGCQECWEKQVDDCWEAIKQFIKTTKHPLQFVMVSIKMTMDIFSKENKENIDGFEQNTEPGPDSPHSNL